MLGIQRTATRLGILLVAIAVVCAGCVDYARIRGIVDESNTLNTIQTESDALAQGWRAAGAGEGAQPSELELRRAAAIQRIDEYIEGHPDQKPTINALRVRKALIFLTADRPNTALAAFDEVDRTQLMSGRDRALYDARRPLAWWWRVAPATSDFPADSVFGSQIVALTGVIDGLPRGSEMRFYLAATRAYIAGKRTVHSETSADAEVNLRTGLSAYASEFDAEDRQRIQLLTSPPAGELAAVPAERLRAYFQATTVARYYRALAQQHQLPNMSWGEAAWLMEAVRVAR